MKFKCKFCNEEFEPHLTDVIQQYCSEECCKNYIDFMKADLAILRAELVNLKIEKQKNLN